MYFLARQCHIRAAKWFGWPSGCRGFNLDMIRPPWAITATTARSDSVSRPSGSGLRILQTNAKHIFLARRAGDREATGSNPPDHRKAPLLAFSGKTRVHGSCASLAPLIFRHPPNHVEHEFLIFRRHRPDIHIKR